MNDQYGRRIDYMRVSVTDRCNLRCVYCMPGEGFSFLPHEDILSFEEIERVCRIGVRLGITKIKLTGGEPLVRRGIPDLVGKLKGIPGIDEVTLTTNGILLKEQINELVSNGLASVNISIDTLDERRYFRMTRGGDIKKALEGMESALKYPDLKVKVNCVPFCEEDCISLALLAKKRKIDVRFIEMMPIGNGKNFNGKMSEEIYKLLHNEFGDYEIYKKTSRKRNRQSIFVFIILMGESDLSAPFRINFVINVIGSDSLRKDFKAVSAIRKRHRRSGNVKETGRMTV